MRKRVWVVMTDFGQYSDHYENIEGIFSTFGKAMKCANYFIEKYNMIKDKYRNLMSWITEGDYNNEINGLDITRWKLNDIMRLEK